jgi:hypothetical protein
MSVIESIASLNAPGAVRARCIARYTTCVRVCRRWRIEGDARAADRAAGTVRRRRCCFSMDALADYSSLLLAIDFLLAMILLDVEMNDPRIRLGRVEARRADIRRRDSER